MPDNGQQPLFYEDIMDAVNKTVNSNPKGLSIKQIAADLWPSRNPDTARSLLSRAINPESHDHNLNPEELTKTMEISGCPEHVIYFMCDRFGFERPSRREKESFKREVRSDLKSLLDQVRNLSRKVELIEEGNK